MVEYEIMVLL